MSQETPLHLYEEITLLALRDEKGTLATGYACHAMAGAILAELLLEERISIAPGRKKLINIIDAEPCDDPVINECLSKMRGAKRRASLAAWVSRLAGIKRLHHKAARNLCRRQILKSAEGTVLLIFSRQVYPTVDPGPEKEILERLKSALLSDRADVDPRTVVLIALANSTGLLRVNLGKEIVRKRRARIKSITEGNAVGAATANVIAACQAATIAAISAANVATISSTR